MARIEIKLSRLGTDAHISIAVNVCESSKPIDFKNPAMASIQCMEDAVSHELPHLTYSAIEAACISGAIYARRKLGIRGLAVELLSVAWTGRVENAEPFAIAVMFAACRVFSKTIRFSDTELNGWTLAL